MAFSSSSKERCCLECLYMALPEKVRTADLTYSHLERSFFGSQMLGINWKDVSNEVILSQIEMLGACRRAVTLHSTLHQSRLD